MRRESDELTALFEQFKPYLVFNPDTCEPEFRPDTPDEIRKIRDEYEKKSLQELLENGW